VATFSSPADFQEHFFATRPQARSVMTLFEYLPSICFYVKDVESRFTRVNAVFLEIFDFSDESEVLGRSDHDFHPPAMAEAYIAEDRRVLRGGKPIPKQAWLVPDVSGTPKWYLSSKVPLYDPDDQVVGIAGAMYPIETPADQQAYFQDLWPAISHMGEKFRDRVSMRQMAQMAGMSSTLFNKRFRALLHITPSDYILALRVQTARRLLTETNLSIAEVAADIGFYDQSHFCKRFIEIAGITPLKYRQRFR
jgi:AraC-like DNA-binding protein